MSIRSALLTTVLLAVAGPAATQVGAPTGSGSSPQSSHMGLSRADVLADIELWHRAGMTYWPHPPAELDMQFVGDYQAGLARYRQLRSAQASTQAVVKYQGESDE